jgi:hypothetical protein
MKLRLFLGGLLVGGAVGLLVGGAVVQVPGDGGGERKYPQGPALLLAIVGGVAAASTLRGSGPQRPHPTGNGEGGTTAPAAPDRGRASH